MNICNCCGTLGSCECEFIVARMEPVDQRAPRGMAPEQALLARLGSSTDKQGDFVGGDRYYDNRQLPTLTYRPPTKPEQTVDGDRVELDELMK